MSTIARQDIFDALSAERVYQDGKWGHAFDDKNTVNDWVTYVIQQAAKASTLQTDHAAFRKAMIKTAATCIAAIESLERNNGLPPRHYDQPAQKA